MRPPPENADPDLASEARRLRFSAPALEQRFRDERLAAGELRARVMAVVATLIVAINGWFDVRAVARTAPFAAAEDLRLRFFVMVPAFLAIAISPRLPGHARRADVLHATAIIAACWANALIYWHFALGSPAAAFGSQVLGSVLPILVISVFGLPLGFRAMLAMTIGTAGGIIGWYHATLGADYARGLTALTTSMTFMCVAAALLGWWRERGERTLFGQREQLRRLTQQLEASNAELARVNTEQAEFMTIAAHDLRAPLATVRGYAKLLHEGRLAEADAQRRALSEIEAQSTRMLSLVSDYLGTHAAAGTARATSGQRIDLAAAARATAARHEAVAAAKAQTIAAPGTEAVWARADEELLAQVTDNFATNALKFSPQGAAVRIEVARAGVGRARLAVIDAGPGIPPEEQAGLFRKFGRASARPTGGEPSHGLGLAVVKRLAEAMEGRVGCDSAPGRGATFWIELPAAD